MRALPVCLVLLATAFPLAAAQVPATVVAFPIDASHSVASFSVRHLGLSRVRGRFDDVRGTLLLDTADVTRSSITILIGTPSIATGNARRDQDLRDNFFEVEQHPTIIFQSAAVARTADGLMVHGSLTIKGVTRPVTLTVQPLGEQRTERTGEWRVGFEGSVAIDRHTYGVRKEGHAAELGGVIGDRVDIELQIEGLQRDYARIEFNSGERPSIGAALLEEIRARGAAAAVRRYATLRATAPDAYNFAARELAVLGLTLLQARDAAAPAILGLYAAADSTSATAHELHGRALAMAGERPAAVAALRRALALDPRATGAMEYLRRLEPPTGPAAR